MPRCAKYYAANRFEVAQMDDLRGAVVGEASVEQRRTVSRTFDRWLSSKNGDEDIAPPDPKLAAELGLPVKDPKDGRQRILSRRQIFLAADDKDKVRQYLSFVLCLSIQQSLQSESLLNLASKH